MDPSLGVLVNAQGPRGSAQLCKVASRRDVDAEQVKAKLGELERQGSRADGLGAKEEEEEHHAHHAGTPRHRLPLYAPPRPRYRWGEPKEDRHPSWGDLFFDLIYVGVSFQAGTLLGEKMSGENVFVFVCTYLVLYSGWSARLMFESMLVVEDNYHRLNYLLQGLLLALAAHCIPDTLAEFEGGNAMYFTIFMVANHVLRLSIWLELLLLEREHDNARRYARLALLLEFVPTAVLALAIVATLYELPFLWVAAIWLASYVVSRLCWLVVIFGDMFKPENAVPWDINYALTRYGQYTMLMLGEGVLQIIIFFSGDEDTNWRLVVDFLLAYLLLGLLQLLHYSTQPFRAEDHVLIRSKRAAVVWIELFAWYSGSQLAVGVALKKLFKVEKDWYKLEEKKIYYYWFMMGSLCVLVFLLAAQQLLHLDLASELGVSCIRDNGTVIRLGHGHERKRTWFVRFTVFPVMYLPFVFMDSRPTGILAASVGLTFGIFVFQVVTGRFKRKRKLNRTVAAIIAIGKLKRRLAERRAAKAAAAEAAAAAALEKSLESTGSSSSASASSDNEAMALDDEEVHAKVEPATQAPAVPKKVMVSAKYSSMGVRIVKGRKGSSFMRAKKATKVSTWQALRIAMRETNFYVPPKPKLSWVNLNTASGEINWADLFFDLTFVGLAYRLNDLQVDELTNLSAGMAWVYVSQFITVFQCWNVKTVLQSQFVTPDVLHKALDVVQGAIIAFLASQVDIQPRVDNLAEAKTGHYAFACGRILFELTVLAELCEIMYHYRGKAPYFVARRNLVSVVVTTTAVALSFWTISNGVFFGYTTLLWSVGYVTTYSLVFVQSMLGCLTQSNTVPMDLSYMLHRYGELAIIMIGEGLLSVILTSNEIESWLHYVDFVLGYIVLCAIRLCYFSIERFDPAETAARRSRSAGITIGLLVPVMFASISAVGGLAVYSRVVLPEQEFPQGQDLMFHAMPFMVLTGCLFLLDMLHEGRKDWPGHNRGLRVVIYLVKLYLVCQFVINVSYGLPSWAVLLADLGTLLCVFFAHAAHIEARLHEKHRRERHSGAGVGRAAAAALGEDKGDSSDEDEGKAENPEHMTKTASGRSLPLTES